MPRALRRLFLAAAIAVAIVAAVSAAGYVATAQLVRALPVPGAEPPATRGPAWTGPPESGAAERVEASVGRLAAEGWPDLRHSHAVIHDVTLAFVFGGTLLAALALGLAWRQVARRAAEDHRAHEALARTTQEANSLLRMTGMLQRSQVPGEVGEAVVEVARRMLPEAAGTLRILPLGPGAEPRVMAWGAAPAACGEGFSPRRCAAVREGMMQVQEPGAAARCPLAPGAEPVLCVPMMAGGAAHGVLQLGGGVAPRSGPCQRIGLAIAEAASLALANIAMRETLRGQALRDPLTGLHNRRVLDEVAEGLALQAARRGAALAVAMLDVDHFKRLNDRHGHATGDAVLCGIARLLTQSLRRSDIACRHGGEEFLVVLPDCDAGQARERMEGIRRVVAAARLAGESGPRVTVSIGIAAVPEVGVTVAEAVRRADAALYGAKRAGRNRVVLAPRDLAARQGRLALAREAAA